MDVGSDRDAARGHRMRGAAVTAIAVGLLVVLLTHALVAIERSRHVNQVRAEVGRTADGVAATMEQVLAAQGAITASLGAWAANEPDFTQEQFRAIAGRLLPIREGIRALEIAPGGIIDFVHPVVGNEAAVGLDLNHHPTGSLAMARLRSGTPVLVEGPINLAQGGQGVILRSRIDVAGDSQNAPPVLWGVAISVLDVDTILVPAGLRSTDLAWGVEQRGGAVASEGLVAGADISGLEPLTRTAEIPGGQWLISMAPKGGWPTTSPQDGLFWFAGLLLALTLGAFAWRLRSEPARLLTLVAAATSDAVESQERTRAIMNTAGDAIVAVDATGVMSNWNPATCRLLRVSDQEMRGKHLRSFLAINEIPLEESDRGLRIGRAAMPVERADGSVFPAEVSVAMSQDRAVRTVIIRDVTEERRQHEDLKRYAGDLERLNREQSAIDALKRDFMAMASHEVRTPITAIRGFALTLNRHWDQLADEDRRRSLDVIHRQATRLWQLVSDVLTTSQLEGGGNLHQRVAPVHVGSAIERAIQDAQVPAADITVDCPPGLTAQVDGEHFTRILVSLLTNAQKYGKPPLQVNIAVDGTDVVARVVDQGPGIPFSFRSRLFEPFSQASTGVTREAIGTGLGLSVARGLARASGGDVWHEDHPGAGATFALRFPRNLGNAGARLQERLDLTLDPELDPEPLELATDLAATQQPAPTEPVVPGEADAAPTRAFTASRPAG